MDSLTHSLQLLSVQSDPYETSRRSAAIYFPRGLHTALPLFSDVLQIDDVFLKSSEGQSIYSGFQAVGWSVETLNRELSCGTCFGHSFAYILSRRPKVLAPTYSQQQERIATIFFQLYPRAMYLLTTESLRCQRVIQRELWFINFYQARTNEIIGRFYAKYRMMERGSYTRRDTQELHHLYAQQMQLSCFLQRAKTQLEEVREELYAYTYFKNAIHEVYKKYFRVSGLNRLCTYSYSQQYMPSQTFAENTLKIADSFFGNSAVTDCVLALRPISGSGHAIVVRPSTCEIIDSQVGRVRYKALSELKADLIQYIQTYNYVHAEFRPVFERMS